MAKVSGYQNRRWKNSIGNVTFRMVRGQMIASEKLPSVSLKEQADKRAQTKGYSGKYMSQRQMAFGLIGRFAKNHEESIRQSFNKTKYGSERNYFMKVNYTPLYNAFLSLYSKIENTSSDTMAVTDEEIEEAVTNYATENPTAIYRVRKSGTPVVYLTGAWDDAANPIMATIQFKGSQLTGSMDAPEIATGDNLVISGQGLTEGSITIGLADSSDGVPTDTPIATALTDPSISDKLVSGAFAAAANGKYLMNIKVGDNVILETQEWESSGSDGSFG